MRISEIETALRRVYLDNASFIKNPNFVRRDGCITWNGDHSHYASGVTFEDLLDLVAKRSYSFQIEDESIVRLYYEYDRDGETLLRASLAFIHSVPCSPTADLYPWMRVDFDPDMASGSCHTHCHLHSSLAEDMRIPVSRVPGPLQFLDMVRRWFYSSGVDEASDAEDYLRKIHRPAFLISLLYREWHTHLAVPGQ